MIICSLTRLARGTKPSLQSSPTATQAKKLNKILDAKQKNVATAKRLDRAYGDTWTWTALEADSKLLIFWFIGARDGDYAMAFMDDGAGWLANFASS